MPRSRARTTRPSDSVRLAAPPVRDSRDAPSLQLIGDGLEGAGQLRAEGRHPAIAATDTRAAIRPYSMAVAPDWSFRKRVKIDMGMSSYLITAACVRANFQRNPHGGHTS